MTPRIFCLLLAALLAFACQDEEAQRRAALRDAQKKEQVFQRINAAWNFGHPPLSPKAQAIAANWNELRLFVRELEQKPTSSIGAFQKKAKTLSTRAKELGTHIPVTFDKPEVKSRLSVLTTKVNSINLFINLQEIPDAKVIAFVRDTNEALRALYREMDEIIAKSEIPKEEGELDMIRMLDTARAIPSKPAPQPIPRPVLPIQNAK